MNNYPNQANHNTARKQRPLWPWIALAVLLIAAVMIWAVWYSANHVVTSADDTGYSYDEPYLAVLHIEDTMTVDELTSAGTGYDHDFLIDTLQDLTEDSNNYGLLLYIDSPGGEVMAASELGEMIAAYRDTGRPLYAYAHSYAASGGYWVAAPADCIYANQYCITGSIGVTYGTMLDLSGLLERYGIRTNTITSGAQKAMGSSFEPMSEETRAIYQSLIDEYYGYFIDWICTQRGMSKQELLPLSDGRIYSATQAAENGLIDYVGDYDDALAALQEEIGLDVAVYEYTPSSEINLMQLFGMKGEENELATLLQLAPPDGALVYYDGRL